MARPRKSEGLRYVYEHRGKWQARYWDKEKLHTVGSFDDPYEAAYTSLVKRQGHHWQGIPEDISEYFGFTYLITNRKTGKKYVGKKQLVLWDGPTGGYKCTTPGSPYWDAKAWKENDWRQYTGSCIPLNKEIAKGNPWDYQYIILEMCRSKLELHLSELKFMVEWDVLDALDECGEYAFWNSNIASLEFRAPFKMAEVEEARAISEDAARRYYLRPTYCACGRMIPFGLPCSCPRGTGLSTLEM